jgi:hypothetical protein
LKKFVVLSLVGVLLSIVSLAQNKALVLENLWINELNNYTPKEFLNKFYEILKDKLLVRQVIDDSLSLKVTRVDDDWKQRVTEGIKNKNGSKDYAYFIAISTDLRLPAINLGKLLFKNPPRTSKLLFTIHVFDAAANEIIADTIVNRGCVVNTLEEGKSSKYFYLDYKSFLNDMACHLDIIKKSLQQITIPKRRVYMEI